MTAIAENNLGNYWWYNPPNRTSVKAKRHLVYTKPRSTSCVCSWDDNGNGQHAVYHTEDRNDNHARTGWGY